MLEVMASLEEQVVRLQVVSGARHDRLTLTFGVKNPNVLGDSTCWV